MSSFALRQATGNSARSIPLPQSPALPEENNHDDSQAEHQTTNQQSPVKEPDPDSLENTSFLNYTPDNSPKRNQTTSTARVVQAEQETVPSYGNSPVASPKVNQTTILADELAQAEQETPTWPPTFDQSVEDVFGEIVEEVVDHTVGEDPDPDNLENTSFLNYTPDNSPKRNRTTSTAGVVHVEQDTAHPPGNSHIASPKPDQTAVVSPKPVQTTSTFQPVHTVQQVGIPPVNPVASPQVVPTSTILPVHTVQQVGIPPVNSVASLQVAPTTSTVQPVHSSTEAGSSTVNPVSSPGLDQTINTTQHVNPNEQVETVEPVAQVEPVGPVESVEPVETIEPVRPVETVGPVETVEPVELVETVGPVEPVQTSPVQSLGSLELHQTDINAETIRSDKTSKMLDFASRAVTWGFEGLKWLCSLVMLYAPDVFWFIADGILIYIGPELSAVNALLRAFNFREWPNNVSSFLRRPWNWLIGIMVPLLATGGAIYITPYVLRFYTPENSTTDVSNFESLLDYDMAQCVLYLLLGFGAFFLKLRYLLLAIPPTLFLSLFLSPLQVAIMLLGIVALLLGWAIRMIITNRIVLVLILVVLAYFILNWLGDILDHGMTDFWIYRLRGLSELSWSAHVRTADFYDHLWRLELQRTGVGSGTLKYKYPRGVVMGSSTILFTDGGANSTYTDTLAVWKSVWKGFGRDKALQVWWFMVDLTLPHVSRFLLGIHVEINSQLFGACKAACAKDHWIHWCAGYIFRDRYMNTRFYKYLAKHGFDWYDYMEFFDKLAKVHGEARAASATAVAETAAASRRAKAEAAAASVTAKKIDASISASAKSAAKAASAAVKSEAAASSAASKTAAKAASAATKAGVAAASASAKADAAAVYAAAKSNPTASSVAERAKTAAASAASKASSLSVVAKSLSERVTSLYGTATATKVSAAARTAVNVPAKFTAVDGPEGTGRGIARAVGPILPFGWAKRGAEATTSDAPVPATVTAAVIATATPPASTTTNMDLYYYSEVGGNIIRLFGVSIFGWWAVRLSRLPRYH